MGLKSGRSGAVHTWEGAGSSSPSTSLPCLGTRDTGTERTCLGREVEGDGRQGWCANAEGARAGCVGQAVSCPRLGHLRTATPPPGKPVNPRIQLASSGAS